MRAAATALLLGAALPLAAHAFDYGYVEAGYIEREDDGGLRLAGSFPLARRWAAFGEFADTGPLEQVSAGLLLHQPLERGIDWTAGLSLESVEAGRHDDTGLGLRAGLRWRTPRPLIELAPEIRHREVFDDGATSLRLAALFELKPPLSLQLALQGGDEDQLEAGLRYAF